MQKIREGVAMAKLQNTIRHKSRWSKVRAKRALRSGMSASEAWAHFKQAVRARRNPNPFLQGDPKVLSQIVANLRPGA